MSLPAQGFHLDPPGGSFTEDAPRPPVPGEEGELVSTEPRGPPGHGFYSGKGEVAKAETSTTTATPRRPDLDLGYEPEGSASPTPPYLRWAESLHSLLDDQDGIHLFRTFLKQEGCVDLLDFWFACSGFRKLEPCEANEEKRLKLAKAIYKKYVLDGQGIVSRQVKAATKSFIKDCVLKQLIDPAMFDQAQTEIQARVEENAYPLFLKSDIYLEYARTGGESPKGYSGQSSGSGNGKGLAGYLPTLNEDEEWKGVPEAVAAGAEEEEEEEEEEEAAATTRRTQDSLRLPSSQMTQKLLLEAAPQRVSCASSSSSSSSSRRFSEGKEFRQGPWRDPVHPYYVNTGYALAPATSANDSEQHSMSSDADTVSLTDSSVDGIPPYRLRKQHRREMQESAKANGRLPLPHIPRTYRMPKDIHVEPQKFAAELIHRLEEVLRDREAEAKLEERLKRVRAEEEEGDDAGLSVGPPLLPHKPLPPPQLLPPHFAPRYAELPPLRDAHEENPESILDEHVQRVMKTPGCQSPKPRSPDSGPAGKPHGLGGPPAGKHAAKTGLKGEAGSLYHHKHVYHHLVHHHGPLKGKEPAKAEAGVRPPGAPFAWTFDPHGSGPKSRVYGESAGLVPGPPEAPLAYGGKGSLLSRQSLKKAEAGRSEGGGHEGPGSPDDTERNQKILQWIIEGEKEISRHKKTSHSSSGPKKPLAHELPPRGPSSVERPMAIHPWVSAQLRNVVQPSHPFVQDPTMPPNPAPNPLTQLEEARRRLEEEEKRAGKNPAKQRYVQEVIQRGRCSSSSARPAGVPARILVPAVSDLDLPQAELKPPKRASGGPSSSSSSSLVPCENIVVAYYFCGEPIPYRTLVRGRLVTLGHFKELLTKKGNYRYYFKKVSDEFDCGVVFEEVREDEALLPIFEEKIIGKVEKID